jgi:hypothetical protein
MEYPDFLTFEDDSLGSPLVGRIWRATAERDLGHAVVTRKKFIEWIDRYRLRIRQALLRKCLQVPMYLPGADRTIDLRPGNLGT